MRYLDLEKVEEMSEFLAWTVVALIALIVVFVTVAKLDSKDGLPPSCFYVAGGLMACLAFVFHGAATRFTVVISPQFLAFFIVGVLWVMVPVPIALVRGEIEARRVARRRQLAKARCDDMRKRSLNTSEHRRDYELSLDI